MYAVLTDKLVHFVKGDLVGKLRAYLMKKPLDEVWFDEYGFETHTYQTKLRKT